MNELDHLFITDIWDNLIPASGPVGSHDTSRYGQTMGVCPKPVRTKMKICLPKTTATVIIYIIIIIIIMTSESKSATAEAKALLRLQFANA